MWLVRRSCRGTRAPTRSRAGATRPPRLCVWALERLCASALERGKESSPATGFWLVAAKPCAWDNWTLWISTFHRENFAIACIDPIADDNSHASLHILPTRRRRQRPSTRACVCVLWASTTRPLSLIVVVNFGCCSVFGPHLRATEAGHDLTSVRRGSLASSLTGRGGRFVGCSYPNRNTLHAFLRYPMPLSPSQVEPSSLPVKSESCGVGLSFFMRAAMRSRGGIGPRSAFFGGSAK